MSDDTSALRDRIARAMSDHVDGNLDLGQEDYADLASAVIPVLLAEVRKGQAEALREEARWIASGLHCEGMTPKPTETMRRLINRADQIEKEVPDEH